MTADRVPRSAANSPSAIFSGSVVTIILKLVALAAIDAFAIWLIGGLLGEQDWLLAIFIAMVTLGINAVFLIDGLYPFRWFSPGLALLIVMIVFPTIYTVYVAFTNYRDGNLLTRVQAEDVLSDPIFLPEDAPAYRWTAFRSTEEAGKYGLWLIPQDEGGEVMFATEGEITPASEIDLNDNVLDEGGIPEALPGYDRLPRGQVIALLDNTLSKIQFGEPDNIIQITLREAAVYQQKYTFDDDGSMLDNETGVTYEPKEGTYTPVSGPNMQDGVVVDAEGRPLNVIRPGFYVVTGLENFQRLIENDRIRGPFIRVFIWTFAHAFLSVFLTFWFGLFMALLLNARFTPGRAVLRTLLLVPYALPAFISVLVWKGLLNEQLGVVNKVITDVFGLNQGPRWTSNATWVKVAILLIQLWLGFPYMMLITTGALQSIPNDIYEAARVDGAGVYQQFRFLTLPLLLVAVGPLLIASFAFNFNNFTIVELFNKGGPPISPDTAAGHSDILITYTYELAFGSGRGADYGFASTISLVIFLIVAVITFFNFRFTQSWEEVSENV